MAVRTSDFTLLDFGDDSIEVVGEVATLGNIEHFVTQMVEFEDTNIRIAAINTRVQFEVSDHVLPSSVAPTVASTPNRREMLFFLRAVMVFAAVCIVARATSLLEPVATRTVTIEFWEEFRFVTSYALLHRSMLSNGAANCVAR